MILQVQTIYSLDTLVQMAIDRIRAFCPADGYWAADSGGKDSGVVLDLAAIADVPFEIHHNLTSVDPPELIRFIRQYHPWTIIDKPEITMWQLIERKKMPPVRSIRGKPARWCCEELKEFGGYGRTVLTGVRWAESNNRKMKRHMVEDRWQSERRIIVNPIIDWSDADVWQYTREHGLPYCSLYDEGFKRLGCIMCPQQGKHGMRRDAERWPKYAAAYIRTFDRVVTARKAAGKRCTWENGQELFDWWVSGASEQPDDGQGCLIFQ